ncbi:hypothetical protein HO133_010320 [Letharia lupina]|uniref:Uncharacterized protein n=1 Tax=Letharia lupina TaxID=560253 RepID=A0A8H6FEQ8_9LECA|nr:uncharacterized protein HO133_010320 [Letharia lupina]KAF6225124.1 hypothetical protein HO133_010320 [Letharia lupina]
MSETLKFLYRQFFLTPPKANVEKSNLRGQTGIVTGSNIGLGFEASRQLLELGLSHLILAVRSKEKGNNARIELAREAPGAKIEVWDLNMSNYESISQFTQRCATLPRLDFAILNAGIFKPELEINKVTGHEEVVQVNYLSTALLAIQLLPVMDKKNSTRSRPGTITIVGSETAEWAMFKEQKQDPIFPAFNNPKYFDMQDRYYTSKLLQEILLIEMCRTLPSSRGIVNVVNPGFCYGSGLHAEVTTRYRALGIVFTAIKRMIGRSTSVGARTLVDAAVAQGPASHGQYLSDCARYHFPPQLSGQKGDALSKRVWNETLKELSFANVEGILGSMKEKEMTGKSKGDYLR